MLKKVCRAGTTYCIDIIIIYFQYKEDSINRSYYLVSFQIKTIVMLNCGGGINISEVLELEDDVRIFILDRYSYD